VKCCSPVLRHAACSVTNAVHVLHDRQQGRRLRAAPWRVGVRLVPTSRPSATGVSQSCCAAALPVAAIASPVAVAASARSHSRCGACAPAAECSMAATSVLCCAAACAAVLSAACPAADDAVAATPAYSRLRSGILVRLIRADHRHNAELVNRQMRHAQESAAAISHACVETGESLPGEPVCASSRLLEVLLAWQLWPIGTAHPRLTRYAINLRRKHGCNLVGVDPYVYLALGCSHIIC
jgi:hypothetical protein